jgi:hypothetical protein
VKEKPEWRGEVGRHPRLARRHGRQKTPGEVENGSVPSRAIRLSVSGEAGKNEIKDVGAVWSSPQSATPTPQLVSETKQPCSPAGGRLAATHGARHLCVVVHRPDRRRTQFFFLAASKDNLTGPRKVSHP